MNYQHRTLIQNPRGAVCAVGVTFFTMVSGTPRSPLELRLGMKEK
jgi:hypothetical protein